jgi:DNA segregation ATPase FtsK/SpoIIIE-like protein
MDKALHFESLADLVEEFRLSYRRNFHTLISCYVGLPFAHGKAVDSPVKWRAVKVRIECMSREEVHAKLESFTEEMFELLNRLRRAGSMGG